MNPMTLIIAFACEHGMCGCHDHDMLTQGVNEGMCKSPTSKGVNVKSPNSLTIVASKSQLIKPKMVCKHHVGYLFFTIYFVPFVCGFVCIFILLPLLFHSLTCTLFLIGNLLNKY